MPTTVTGIYPYNRHIFGDEDYVVSDSDNLPSIKVCVDCTNIINERVKVDINLQNGNKPRHVSLKDIKLFQPFLIQTLNFRDAHHDYGLHVSII